MDYQVIIDRYYPIGTRCREIYMRHAEQVATLAVELARRCHTGLDENQVCAAAMLHDIGIFATNAHGIHCYGDAPYIRHGVIGGELLRKEGAPEEWARVAERHTGAGIPQEEILSQGLDLPLDDYIPVSMLEKLVCYADKFYSKSGSMEKKTFSRVRNSIARHGGDSLERFDLLYKLFGDGSSGLDI